MNVPEAILEEAASVASSLLPEKSSSRYKREYRDFKNWQRKNGVNGVTEDVLLVYMNQLSANSAQIHYGQKEIKESVQIRRFVFLLKIICKNLTFRFQKVIAFLKRKNERYIPRKAKVLTKEQVERFCWMLLELAKRPNPPRPLRSIVVLGCS
ncbi:hypothetical protein NQ315_008962 [Exocentrus adspersus]|uniref:Uncharacterized protein n=1 Tax=Exocentrus adspersus TaxID=1586481 RepID=A0AAV8VIY1_9CUCU|nr:hypothetical protein NQ315_008962 [Exocentrus adspersus]